MTGKPRVPPAAKALQLRIALRYIQPPIWRRVLVPDTFTLGQLHDVIQAAMGWDDGHLHAFRLSGRRFGPALPEFGSDVEGVEDEDTTLLGDVLTRKRQKLNYEYDFGDGWEHEIGVEAIVPYDPQARYPVCLDGARACPPEDCGGIPGYMGILEALSAPTRTPEQAELLEWMPARFDPERFDLAEVNRRMGGSSLISEE